MYRRIAILTSAAIASSALGQAPNGPRIAQDRAVVASRSAYSPNAASGAMPLDSLSADKGVLVGRQATGGYDVYLRTIPGTAPYDGTLVMQAKTINLQGILASFKPIQLRYSGVPGDADSDAIGSTAWIANIGPNGGNAERLDHVAGANVTGAGFEVGKSFYAHCDALKAGQCLSYFGLAQSPKSTADSWGMFGFEINPSISAEISVRRTDEIPVDIGREGVSSFQRVTIISMVRALVPIRRFSAS